MARCWAAATRSADRSSVEMQYCGRATAAGGVGTGPGASADDAQPVPLGAQSVDRRGCTGWGLGPGDGDGAAAEP